MLEQEGLLDHRSRLGHQGEGAREILLGVVHRGDAFLLEERPALGTQGTDLPPAGAAFLGHPHRLAGGGESPPLVAGVEPGVGQEGQYVGLSLESHLVFAGDEQ